MWPTSFGGAKKSVLGHLVGKSIHKDFCVRFEVFTAVTMKNAVFWDVALCRSSELNRCFRGTSVQFTRSTRHHIPEDGILHKDFIFGIGEYNILEGIFVLHFLHNAINEMQRTNTILIKHTPHHNIASTFKCGQQYFKSDR
jgi:hypothetical protein